MKRAFLLLTVTSCFVFLFLGNAKSQKLDDFDVTFVYRQLALTPLPKELKTYSAEITYQNQRVGEVISKYDKKLPYEVFQDNREEMIQKYLVIEGLNKVPNGNVRVTLSFGQYQVTESQAHKNSNEVTTSTAYSFKMPSKLTLMTGSGTVLYDKYLYDEKFIFTLNRTHSQDGRDFTNYLNDHISKTAVNMALDRVKLILYDNFSTPIIRKEVRMYSAKGKKLDYSDVEKANEIFRFKILTINENTPVSDYQEKINDAISAWKAILKEADYTNEKARINSEIAAGLLYNISFAYLIINDFGNSLKILNEAKSVKTDFSKKFRKDMQQLEEFIKSQELRLNANHI